MPFTPSSSSILSSGGAVVGSDLTIDTDTITVDETNDLVGIGTDSPSTALHVKSETGDTAIKVQAGSVGDTDGAAQVTFSDYQRTASIGLMSTDIVIAKDASIDPLSDNRRVTINVDSGNVGIGHKFGQHRQPGGSASASVLNVENVTTSGSAQGGNIRLGSNDGAVMGSGHRLGVIEFAGSEAASPGPAGSAMAVGARIEAVTDAEWSTTENGTNIDFYTTDGDAVQTKQMTIAATGNVGIGPTAPAKNLHVSKASGEATIRLQSAGYYADFYQSGANLFIQNAAGGGNIIFYDDSAERMRIDTDGDISANGAITAGGFTAALSSGTGILIDQDYTDTDAATIVCLDVDFDKAAAASNNTMIGVNVDMDSTASTGGSSTMTGIKVTPTCTQASGSTGVFTVKGMEVVATGSSAPEQSTVRALDLVATGGDYTQGILLQTDDANGWDMKILSSATVADFCTIETVANGATTIETVDGSGADADLTFTIDGDFLVTATSASFVADVSIAEAKHFNIAAPSLPTTDHTSTGLSAQMLAGEEVNAFQTCCISATAGDVIVSDSNAASTMPVIGIAPAGIANDATGAILLNGFIRDDSWSWTAGSILYASETAGAMTHTAPTTSGALVQPLGVALTATVVLFQPSLSVVEVA